MKKYNYVVHYGLNISTRVEPNWKEAAAFIKYCLDTGIAIRAVEKKLRPAG